MFAGFLGLIALHAVGTQGGSGRVAEAFADLSRLIDRVIDPAVPAIPDRRGAGAGDPSPASTDELREQTPGGTGSGATGRTAPRLPVPQPPK